MKLVIQFVLSCKNVDLDVSGPKISLYANFPQNQSRQAPFPEIWGEVASRQPRASKG